ncbi:sigma-54-dependent Fis family transcriptional regulator [Vibrio sinaloensis]|uniref:sigma-54-dependent Fis family transcriptional regulator n=1 Tax=Photobacterium sp. (strain ATCC 43367) TaxID=379097 RepID=UPI0035EDBD4C
MELQLNQTDSWLASSWKRSTHAGLKQLKKPEDIIVSSAQLKQRQYDCKSLIDAVERCAKPLFNQVMAHTDSRLILTDSEGVILNSWGQERFREKLTSIALSSGSCWQERLKGTNAIGTALHEQRAVSVIGDEHYIRHHRFISCSASPLLSHDGKVLGVLDITSEQHHHDAMVQLLVQNMVQAIENDLLSSMPGGALRIDFALDESVLSSGWQGILIVNEQGKVVGHNQLASQMIPDALIKGQQLEHILEFARESKRVIIKKHALGTKNLQVKNFPNNRKQHSRDQAVEKAWQHANKVVGKDISLLILGETGVGKGEFVKALHGHSERSKHNLVSVNCGALPKDLLESELFGYAPGAFTGASSKGYMGKIRQADKGTLFLDEIGEMPLEAQCRLLTVLQDKTVMPVGSLQSHKVDIQVIAATHQDLPKLVQQGLFREDLYYRLNGLTVSLPALRDRTDKSKLIHSIHQKYSDGKQSISAPLMQLLTTYHWPGNLRELDNVLKVATVIASEAQELCLEHVPEHLKASMQLTCTSSVDTEEDIKTVVNSALLEVYEKHNGNISKVARVLGVSRNTIYRRMKALNRQRASK